MLGNLPACLAARDVVGDAVDVGGALGGEVGDEVGDLGEFAAASERRGLRTRVPLAQVIDGDAARVGEMDGDASLLSGWSGSRSVTIELAD